MDTIWFVAVIALVTAPFVVWAVIKSRPNPPGAFVDTTSSEWQEAVAKAQKSIPIEYPPWRIAPTEALIAEYEAAFSLALPEDYRAFLFEHGGCTLSARAPVQEPTPFGDFVMVNYFFGFMNDEYCSQDVRWNTSLIEGAPDIVAIAGDFMGGMIWLRCTGTSAGAVYFHDPERRVAWSDEKFRSMFENLDPLIEDYLTLRRSGALPPKRPGHDNVYVLGHTFTEFLDALSPEPLDEHDA
jgi:hypothetical protein